MFSPNGAYLFTDPDSRLWVGHADGSHGRFFNLHLSRNCVMAQSRWLANSAGLAYVVLCLIPNHNAVTSTLYSRALTSAAPHRLARVYSPSSGDQDAIQLAPSYRIVAGGY